MLIAYPNHDEGRKINRVVSLTDIMPTILDVLGYYDKIPHGVQGKSLLRNESKEIRSIIGESFPADPRKISPRFDRIERTLYSGTEKFIRSTRGKRELYDLRKDSDEQVNRYHANDALSMQLESRLDRWLKTVKTPSTASPRLDQAATDRLKALGYIQ